MLHDEEINTSQPLTVFHPTYTWKETTFEDYTIKELHYKPLFVNGECKFKSKPIIEIQQYVQDELNTLWDAYRRLTCPKTYKVDLSQELWDLKTNLLGDKIVQKQ